jgi:hypothetical protein
VLRWLQPGQLLDYTIQAICTVGVVATGKLWMKWKIAKTEREAESFEQATEVETSRVRKPCPSSKHQ